MTDELFRKEAMDFAVQRLHGHVVVMPRFSHLAAALFLVAGVVLSIVSLLLGVNVEKLRVVGRVEWQGAHQIEATLLLPERVAAKLERGSRLQLRIADVSNIDARVPAEVENVSAQRMFTPASERGPGLVYLPARLRLAAADLRAAGLPLEQPGAVTVDTYVVTSRKSWLRWVVERIGNDA